METRKASQKKKLIIGVVIALVIVGCIGLVLGLLLRSSSKVYVSKDPVDVMLNELNEEFKKMEDIHQYDGYEVTFTRNFSTWKGELNHSGVGRFGSLFQYEPDKCDLCGVRTLVKIRDFDDAILGGDVEIHRLGNELVISLPKERNLHMKHWFDEKFLIGTYFTLNHFQKKLLNVAFALSFHFDEFVSLRGPKFSTFKSPIGARFGQIGNHCYLTIGELDAFQWSLITSSN